jgi:hypothetical protein
VPPDFARRRLSVLTLGCAFLAAVAVALAVDGDDTPTPANPATTTSSGAARSTTTTIDIDGIAPTDEFSVAAGSGPVVGSGERYTYTVEVEAGIPIDPEALAAVVDAALGDPRGWTAAGAVSLQRVGPSDAPRFHIRLATPATTDARCAPLETDGEVSCRNGADVMINLRRWLEGAPASELSIRDYRTYVVNHEVGHALGYDHVDCPGPGAVAPVMVQQTLGLGGCLPNPWPHPDGAATPAGS